MSSVKRCVLALAALLIVASYLAPDAISQERVVKISTLEWPPYSSQYLRQGGATTEVIRAAFGKVGYKVEVTYEAWPTAVELARKGINQVVAYYPGYHCRHRAGFIASDPVGHSPLGFAEQANSPLNWQSLDDIGDQNLKIGVVRGYTNTDEFDAKVGMGWIRAIPSDNDAENLRRLLRGRIDAAVVDKYVLAYLKTTDEQLKQEPNRLRFNEKPLEQKKFYLCFRDDENGVELMRAFNTGLEEVDVDSIVESYVMQIDPE